MILTFLINTLAVLHLSHEHIRTNGIEIDKNYGKTWLYFPDENEQPEKVYLMAVKYEPVVDDINRYASTVAAELYTRESPQQPKRIVSFNSISDKLIEFNCLFRPDLETKIIIHGWRGGPNTDTVQNIKSAYFKMGHYNIIVIDWKEIASNVFYFYVVTQLADIGQYTANMIDYLIKVLGADPAKIHIIGHSLGAHISGFAGSYTKKGRILRITGLDPAMPLFEDDRIGPERRLDPTDAIFVDIIHTCAGVLGFKGPLGHVDFYPNGGKDQPGCTGLMKVYYEHARSHEYFAESIENPNHFLAYPCDSWKSFIEKRCKDNPISMGESVPKTANGTYFLKTRATYLYGMDGKETDNNVRHEENNIFVFY